MKSVKIIAVFLVLVVCATATAKAQCELQADKKLQKKLDEATSGKVSLREAEDLIRGTLEADENCVPCRFLLGKLLFNARTDSRDEALGEFQAVKARCPDFHADVDYYLGVIEFGRQEYTNALMHFQDFLAYQNPDKARFSSDHAKKVRDVQDVLPEAKFYGEFYENIVPFDPYRIAQVSTAGEEYLPMLSPDNELLYFTRKTTRQNKGDLVPREVEEFTLSRRASLNEKFTAGQPLAPPFNVGDNYGGVSLSLDNREMFVTVCKPGARGYNNCDLYVTRYNGNDGASTGSLWSGLENLGPTVNTPDGWEAQPTLSADGKTLYFATVRAGTTPDADGNPTIDIYFSERGSDGKWSSAKPLQGPINTAGNDKSPFLHADSRTLYFSSNGRLGAGGYDIYYARQNNDGSWQEPRNIGYPINTPADEHGLIVSVDGTEAYFASSGIKGSQGLDIYAFRIPSEARPEKVLLLKGEVRNENGELVEDAKVQLKLADEVRDVEVQQDNGSYAAVVNIEREKEVLLTIESPNNPLAFASRVFTLADTARPVLAVQAPITEIKPGETYELPDVRFATNSSDIEPESRKVLAEFAEFLKRNPNLKVEIRGHTDSVGDEAFNKVLSTDRAFEVMGFLQDEGVAGQRIRFAGFGSSKPIASNATAEGRQKNRRTEFVVLP